MEVSAMTFFLQGFGVFLGVLAGTAVTILAAWLIKRHGEKQQKVNLLFELELNVRKIDVWLEEIGKLRNAINGDAMHQYCGYFDLSRILSVTCYNMFQSGLLYKYLDHDAIGTLQVIFSEFSHHGEQYFNNQINQITQSFNNAYAQDQGQQWLIADKAAAVGIVDFWENKLIAHKQSFHEIVTELKGNR